ncbi:unnamed protein product [Mycena citricolor]|uniref:Tetraspanin Tsp2 n=1 Tax=Mycena citricolor TaxID=2018698 RepID=A0AAD2H2I7_9AGAR|nr:unnamed protein product [Mycena citricolor]
MSTDALLLYSPRAVGRRDSSGSQTPSMAGSTRHLIPNKTSGFTSSLQPPSAPFLSSSSPSSPGNSRPSSPAGSMVSLAHNYLPTKFSSHLLTRRRPKGSQRIPGLARGGGVDAFRAGASRIPGAGDEDDYTSSASKSMFSGAGRGGKKVRWTRFKVILFIANLILIVYSLGSLVTLLLVYFHVFRESAVLLIANKTELALSTLAAAFLFCVSLLGLPGILLNNRPFLAVYTFLLWVGFGLMVVPGYITYKHRNLNLEGKVNQQWSRGLSSEGRLIIQGALQCCGYFSPFVEATVSATCYSRSTLPGCKKPFLDFQRSALERFYAFSFAFVPVQIGIILSALLCSNHVTYRFGKGMMPKAYQLKQEDIAIIVDKYASQLADQYGAEGAAQLMANASMGIGKDPFASPSASANASATEINLQNMPTMYHGDRELGSSHVKYDSVGSRAPDSADPYGSL